MKINSVPNFRTFYLTVPWAAKKKKLNDILHGFSDWPPKTHIHFIFLSMLSSRLIHKAGIVVFFSMALICIFN